MVEVSLQTGKKRIRFVHSKDRIKKEHFHASAIKETTINARRIKTQETMNKQKTYYFVKLFAAALFALTMLIACPNNQKKFYRQNKALKKSRKEYQQRCEKIREKRYRDFILVKQKIRQSRLKNNLTYEDIIQKNLHSPAWRCKYPTGNKAGYICCSGRIDRKNSRDTVSLYFTFNYQENDGELKSVYFDQKEHTNKEMEIFIREMIEYAQTSREKKTTQVKEKSAQGSG